ncbi:hypothetical protein OPT61_g9249 [Boeremia exigua]|uniref:Uncharacterized protein n=1 Tax=Boeremia exigua TaxID=749465 RepID=A0ACC2HW01_9PLEO|nr:hypothetical protein OPT61_g9249 [Boeremia exigua]
MVTTRGSSAKTAPPQNDPPRPAKRIKLAAISRSGPMPKTITTQPFVVPYSSPVTDSSALSMRSNEPSEPAISSPSTGASLEGYSISINKRPLCESSKHSTVAVPLKRATIGSSHNPIVLDDSPQLGHRDRNKQHGRVEPHQFQHKHGKLRTYKTPRTLLPKPGNANAINGQLGRDLYWARNAETGPTWHTSRSRHAQPKVLFGTQYQMPTQYSTSNMVTAYPPAKPVQYFAPPLPYQQTVHPQVNEDRLRRKAAQYVQEYSKPSRHKGKTVASPDRTGASGPETGLGQFNQDDHLAQAPSCPDGLAAHLPSARLPPVLRPERSERRYFHAGHGAEPASCRLGAF